MSSHSKHVARKTPQRAKSKTTMTKIVAKKKARPKSNKRQHQPDLDSRPPRKKRRYKPGTIALREIRAQQKSIELAVPRLPFSRVVREISTKYKQDLRWQKTGLLCLQAASEQFLIDMMQDANLLAIHGKRVTLQKKDLDLVKILQPNKFPDSMYTRSYSNWHHHIPRKVQMSQDKGKGKGKGKARSYAKR